MRLKAKRSAAIPTSGPDPQASVALPTLSTKRRAPPSTADVGPAKCTLVSSDVPLDQSSDPIASPAVDPAVAAHVVPPASSVPDWLQAKLSSLSSLARGSWITVRAAADPQAVRLAALINHMVVQGGKYGLTVAELGENDVPVIDQDCWLNWEEFDVTSWKSLLSSSSDSLVKVGDHVLCRGLAPDHTSELCHGTVMESSRSTVLVRFENSAAPDGLVEKVNAMFFSLAGR